MKVEVLPTIHHPVVCFTDRMASFYIVPKLRAFTVGNNLPGPGSYLIPATGKAVSLPQNWIAV